VRKQRKTDATMNLRSAMANTRMRENTMDAVRACGVVFVATIVGLAFRGFNSDRFAVQCAVQVITATAGWMQQED
jgi:hypothetical protein